MKIEIGKSYKNRHGDVAYIMGPTRRGDEMDAQGSLWSLQGNHYMPDGRFISIDSDGQPWVLSEENYRTLIEECETIPEHRGLADEHAATLLRSPRASRPL